MRNERMTAFEYMKRKHKQPIHPTGGLTVKIKNYEQEDFLKQ